MKKMEASGLIRGYTAQIDERLAGFGCISGFYKAVKDVTGLSPGRLAKQIADNNG